MTGLYQHPAYAWPEPANPPAPDLSTLEGRIAACATCTPEVHECPYCGQAYPARWGLMLHYVAYIAGNQICKRKKAKR